MRITFWFIASTLAFMLAEKFEALSEWAYESYLNAEMGIE